MASSNPPPDINRSAKGAEKRKHKSYAPPPPPNLLERPSHPTPITIPPPAHPPSHPSHPSYPSYPSYPPSRTADSPDLQPYRATTNISGLSRTSTNPSLSISSRLLMSPSSSIDTGVSSTASTATATPAATPATPAIRVESDGTTNPSTGEYDGITTERQVLSLLLNPIHLPVSLSPVPRLRSPVPPFHTTAVHSFSNPIPLMPPRISQVFPQPLPTLLHTAGSIAHNPPPPGVRHYLCSIITATYCYYYYLLPS